MRLVGKREREAPRFEGNVLATRVGLHFPQSLTYDEWERAGYKVARIASSSAWFIGDWVAFGSIRYESRYRDAIEAVGLDYQTIRNYAWVARKFELARRRENLSFQHHTEVASLPAEEQDYWLTRAEECGWSRNQLRRNIRGTRKPTQRNGEGELVQPLRVDRDRVAWWTRAAELAGSSLETWIIANIDQAANNIFTNSGEATSRVTRVVRS
ncbi:LmbU family transcriptional regulator [Streptomyces hygroscopicus]|uniref:LmbU family transcriptional regulator n=1 Tax=Streptomyces hygroscopicus TaxID=1912 RepID=UPI0036CF820B